MKTSRSQRLMPKGIPRWIRCYDNGGKSIDRYTVVFTGHWRKRGAHDAKCQYIAMNAAPFHPQGFGQHGESPDMIDVNRWGFAPMIGRRNHLGVRIKFKDLPDDCRKLVIRDYKEIWKI